MAIQTRRGNFTEFNPNKMLPGEWATALADDPSAKDGAAVYMCFAPGNTKRMATYQDMQENIKAVTQEITDEVSEKIIKDAQEGIQIAVDGANQAANRAEQLTQEIQTKLDNGDFIGPEGPVGPAGGIDGLEIEPVEFVDAQEVESLTSGDTVSTLFGKINTFMKAVEEGGIGGNMLDKVYPIGAIYMSASASNPGELFGGTWTSWGAGRVPVGVDTEQTEFAQPEREGGEKDHILTIGELASHTHTQNEHNHSLNGHTHGFSANTGGAGNHTHTGRWKAMNAVSMAGGSYLLRRVANEDSYDGSSQVTDSAGNHTHSVSGTTGGSSGNTGDMAAMNQNTGNSDAHNNLQPYITCYMWKRIA